MYNQNHVVNTEKINVTSALSRVESELHQAEVTAVVRYQTSKKESPPTVRYSGGHDHQTAAVVTTARSPLLPSQQPRRCQRWNGYDTTGRSPLSSTSTQSFHAVSRTTERLSHEIRRRTHRQHHASTNGCFHDLHTSFTWEEDVCSHWQLELHCPLARQRAADHHRPSP